MFHFGIGTYSPVEADRRIYRAFIQVGDLGGDYDGHVVLRRFWLHLTGAAGSGAYAWRADGASPLYPFMRGITSRRPIYDIEDALG